ncbi:hypothetical protein D9757_006568 [Collybiopsis confluens]|uniref:Uncharacterized protein n=1 Tax=Collybiopsis confluens TaxID=2823264 RepID=A0A8H5MAP3_9AGAR|nr:hypothetical protein D9757_006568 [Collybiopsis confluens]
MTDPSKTMLWKDVQIGPKFLKLLRLLKRFIHTAIYQSQLDHWWHSPQLRYLVENPNAPQPKICIINPGEGEPDHPSMSAHFMINLNLMRVTDKFTDEKFAAPAEIWGLLKEVRDYAIAHYVATKEAKLQHERKQEEIRQARLRKEREDISAFHQKLVQNEIMGEDKIEVGVSTQLSSALCPVCFDEESENTSQLIRCRGCSAYVCPNPDCEAFTLDGVRQCNQHPHETYCKACHEVQSGSSTVFESHFKRGPKDGCNNWMCKSDWKWCKGEPMESVKSTTAEEAEGSDHGDRAQVKKRKVSQPRHEQARLAPCSTCLQRADVRFEWDSCDAFYCWSKKGVG